MPKSRKLLIYLLITLLIVLCGCGDVRVKSEDKDVYDGTVNDYAERVSEIKAGDRAALLQGVGLDLDNAFFDGFDNGVDFDSWYIGKQAWGAGGNGGVIPQNVAYTDDGTLILYGNGGFYTSGDVSGVGSVKDGSLTGAALISKFVTGPGRYQVKMKVLPRLGACSAFWTYCYDSETLGNHEIDIELPGGKDNHVISFENVLNTNYITVSMNESQDVNVAQAFGSKENIALNDGEWHTFGFDWYTDPETVVYYVDGRVTAVSNIFVPTFASRLWLGVWFPNTSGFVGDADFESDAMFVDWVQYIPFADQPYTAYVPTLEGYASADEYPSAPVSAAGVNKVANGNFEYYLKKGTAEGYGWQLYKRVFTPEESAMLQQRFREEYTAEHPDATEEEIAAAVSDGLKAARNAPASDYCKVSGGVGLADSCGAEITKTGLLRQKIDGVYSGFDVRLSVYAKGKGVVTVQFLNNIENVIEQKTLSVDSDEWKQVVLQATAPTGTQKVYVTAYSSDYDGTFFADEFVLNVN